MYAGNNTGNSSGHSQGNGSGSNSGNSQGKGSGSNSGDSRGNDSGSNSGGSPEGGSWGRYSARDITTGGLAAALVFAAALVHIRIPAAGAGGMIHLGDLPLFVSALLYGRRTGALAGALGLSMFDLLSGWALWSPFSFVIGGLSGYIVGAAAEKNPGGSAAPYAASILGAGLVTAAGYYLAEGLLYGNWLAPAASLPVNALQIILPALFAPYLAKRLKNK